MPPLRILHVAPYSERAWAYGGIPRVVGSLARAQARAGHQVTVAATDVLGAGSRVPAPGGRWSRRRPWQERTPDGVEACFFPNLSNRLASRWQLYLPLGLRGFLRERGGDFDVAHLHACHNLPVALAARACRRAGVPYVVQPNGTARRIERRRAAKWLFDLLFGRGLLEGAAAVIAVSDWERRQLEADGLPGQRCHVVPNPLAPATQPPPGGAAFRRRLGLSADPIILFLGILSPRKHPEVLVEAAARLSRPVQLVFAGPDLGAAAATRQAVERLGLRERVHLVGVLEADERFAALAAADVLVYASRDEAFGLSALEALQAGTPVVVGGDAGCAEMIGSVEGGLIVKPGDARELAGALARMLARLPVWKSVARQAGAVASTRFHPDAVWAALEPVYRSVVAGAPLLPAPGADEPAPASPAAAASTANPASPVSGVTFIVAVHNGAPWLERVLEAIEAERDGRPFEVIAVDDGSTDESAGILEGWMTGGAEAGAATASAATAGAVAAGAATARAANGVTRRVITLGAGGHPAAVNAGLRAASHPVIGLVDQDVVLQPGWLKAIEDALGEPAVGAAQGTYLTDPDAGLVARVMGLDLAERYAAMPGPATGHVCTGNSAYRLEALRQVGIFFDESFGYGADNDMSYRLAAAGHQLRYCAGARAVHHWRASLGAYLRQQYGLGYGRLDLVAKHPRHAAGDTVSPATMMAHAPLMLAALGLALAWLASLAWGRPAALAGGLSLAIVTGLALERLVAGVRAALRRKDAAGLLFAPLHLARDLAWSAAIVVWLGRRLLRRGRRPEHSMGR